MDQFDLFTTDQPQTTEVVVTPIEVDTPPVQTPLEGEVLPPLNETVPNILLFAVQHQKQMWTAFKHRRDCLMQVRRFAEFRDYGARPMNEITQRDIIDYRTHLLEYGGMKAGTINRHLSAVSACFRYAVDDLGLLHDRPKSCLLKEEQPNTRAFTPEIVDKLVQHFVDNGDQWMADMVILASKTGMRQGEIVSVHLDCVTYDEVSNELWLPPEITKAKKGRFVPLNAEGAFEAYQRLVLNIGRQYSPTRFYNRWWDAKEALGYKVGGRNGADSWFKFHATRHTAATNMVRKGINALVIAEVLGHSDIKTTQKYAHVDGDARRAATAGL